MNNIKSTKRALPSRGGLIAVVALILIAWIAPSTPAGERGRCASARLPWPIILPDGSSYPAGSISVCMERKLTGVSALHEVRVDGFPVGMFMSRIGSAEGPAGDSVILVFERNSINEHRLIGYTRSDGDRLRTYALYHPKSLREQGKSMRVAALDLSDASSVQIAIGTADPRHKDK